MKFVNVRTIRFNDGITIAIEREDCGVAPALWWMKATRAGSPKSIGEYSIKPSLEGPISADIAAFKAKATDMLGSPEVEQAAVRAAMKPLDAALQLVCDLQEAHGSAEPLVALVLQPMIREAQQIVEKLRALESALQQSMPAPDADVKAAPQQVQPQTCAFPKCDCRSLPFSGCARGLAGHPDTRV